MQNLSKSLRRAVFTGFLLGVAGLGGASGTSAATPVAPVASGYQLVQSVPEETNLEVPGVPRTETVWIEMIRNAKTSIDLAQFYVSSEPKALPQSPSKDVKQPLLERPLEKVVAELEKAAARGVKIRLLISDAMVNEDPTTLARIKKIHDAQVRSLDLSKVSGGVHHAKYWVIDQKRVFLGSANLDWRSLRHIHELGVFFEDRELAKQLSRVFDLDWKLVRTQEVPLFNNTGSVILPGRAVELVASPASLTPPDLRPALPSLVELLEQAKKTIQIQTMEYSPVSGNYYWPEIDNALRSAALRGVRIQLLVPENNLTGRPGDYLKSLAMLPGVEIKWVKIPKWSSGEVPYARLIRSKYMVIDESVFWLGNSNWTKGYFYNSRNLELIFNRPELARQGLQIFNKVWDSSYAEKLDAAKAYRALK